MKKHAFITLCLMFLLLFVAVSCNPEVKADPLDEQKQSIPAENVDMTNAPAVTEAQESSFTADYYAAKDRVFSGLIAKSLTTENFSIVDALNYYFTGRTPKAVDEGTSEGSDEADVSVQVESMSGELSMKANKMVFEYTSTPEGDSEPVVEEITIENISATATLSGKSISIKANGTVVVNDVARLSSITLPITIDDGSLEIGDSVYDSAETAELIGKLLDLDNTDVMEISGMTVEAKAIAMSANIVVKGFAMSMPATAAIEGKASVEISKASSSKIEISSFALSVDIPQLADVDVSIRGLVFNATKGLTFSGLTIDKISLKGTILPLMDNITFEASINGAFLSDSHVIAIDSVDASAMGYGSIAAAAEIKGILIDIPNSSEEGALAFSFGAAVSFGNQTIGIRGDLSSNPLEITMLNGNPVDAESLIGLIMRLISSSDEGTV